jgi:hypothetical protein
LPWKHSTKGPFNQVLDFLSRAPDILRQADKLKDLKSYDLLLTSLKIVDLCWKLDADLQRFYDHLELSTSGPLYWPKLSTEGNPADDPEQGKVFPVAFHFSNLRMANAVMLYWATCLMLWSGLSQLYNLIPTILIDRQTIDYAADPFCYAPPNDLNYGTISDYENSPRSLNSIRFDMTRLPPLDYRVDFMPMVRNICQSVEYCMQDEMLGLGPSSISAPLNIVIEHLKDHPKYMYSRELPWARAALNRVRKGGLRILGYYDRL